SQPETSSTTRTATSPIDATTEVFHVGDQITVGFTDTPTLVLPTTQQIKPDGTITLLYNETFVAAGKSRAELEKEIRARYVPRIFHYMTVMITPMERYFFVDGEVKGPGKQLYTVPITVLKAIASVGGFTDFAKKTKVRITRMDGTKETVNCTKAIQ